MAYEFSSADCPCRSSLPETPMKTEHEDDMIVVDVPTEIMHRCTGCGRKFKVELVPGDYMLGKHCVSEGSDGKPLLSRPKPSPEPPLETRPRSGRRRPAGAE